MIISGIISAALLVYMAKQFKTEEKKIGALKFFAIITVIIHYSSLWVDFFSTGSAEVASVMLLPIHPCNVCMWLLVACAFVKKRDGEVYRILTEYTFWAGCVCGFIGILLNENYDSNPTLLDYEVLKGLLSHSTMVIGCAYLAVSGIVKIRVKNVLSAVAGLLFFVVDGAIINTLYAIFKLDPCNSMYLLEPPFSDIPSLITPVMGLMGVAVAFGVTALYEQIFLPKEERWYTLLKNKSTDKNKTDEQKRRTKA
jgi:hypothetical protein